MATSIKELRARLRADEPDYPGLARLGPSVLPLLAELVNDRFSYVAANAATLAGMIGGDAAIAALERAARSQNPLVRTAAASALGKIEGPKSAALLAKLLSDGDRGVRKFAIKSAAAKPNAALTSKVAEMSKSDPEPHLRSFASKALAGGGTRRA